MAVLKQYLNEDLERLYFYPIMTFFKIWLHFIDFHLELSDVLFELVDHMLADRSIIRFTSLMIGTLRTPSIFSTLGPVSFPSSSLQRLINTKEIIIHIFIYEIFLLLFCYLTDVAV